MPDSIPLAPCGRLLCFGVALMTALAGCADRSEQGLAPTPPVGLDIQAIEQRQMDGAMADRLTVYRHEWADSGDTPGPYGSQHLEDITSLAAETSHPILIERDPDPRLNEARRDFLVRYFAERHVPDAMRRVIVGRPAAPGISGDEAVEINRVRSSAYSAGGESGGSSGKSNSSQSGGGF